MQARALGLDLFAVPLGDDKGDGGYAEIVRRALTVLRTEIASERY